MKLKAFSEKTLVQKLDKILKKKFLTDTSFKEFSAGYGIADLVFAPDFSFKRNTTNRAPLTNFNILRILLTLKENREYPLEELYQQFNYLTNKEVNKYITFLEKNKYLHKVNKKTYIKFIGESDINPIKKIIAIEAKLFDYKNGLIQARRYQYFADESYLAILKKTENNINFEEFNKYNIGLILFDDKNGDIEIRYPQKINNIFESNVSLFAKELMINRFISPAF